MTKPIKVVHLNKTVLHLNPSNHFQWMAENCPPEILKSYLDELESRKVLIRNQKKQIHDVSQKLKRLNSKVANLRNQVKKLRKQ